jgi:hypothetical protein
MFQRHIAVVVGLSVLTGSFGFAGIRSAGKYCGVVVFDRWDGCTLCSSAYVMYISESIKEELREHAGKCVQIDATRVHQPWNPGDGLIQEMKVLGPAPLDLWSNVPDHLKLIVHPEFEDGHAPEFVIRAENSGETPLLFRTGLLAPTVLTGQPQRCPVPDGPSGAVVTRRFISDEQNDDWTVMQPSSLPGTVELLSGDSFEIQLRFQLPAGKYDVFAGYGGGVHAGLSVASNLIGFDVDSEGRATRVEVKGR